LYASEPEGALAANAQHTKAAANTPRAWHKRVPRARGTLTYRT
jgi:hypothetical protein